MTNDQTIPCPVCQTPITFNTRALLTGVQFVCTNCGSAIGLSAKSAPVVSDTMDKFEKMKQELGKKKKS